MKYKDEDEIKKLVAAFEDATIARDVWKHAEHLVVALSYANKYRLETAIVKMKDGLFNLLTEGFKIDLTKEMPYHETLTVFWMRTVSEFARSTNGMPLHEKANSLIETFDKDYPLRFYSREYLFSDEARARFVEPDLCSNHQPPQSS
ncbi:MAG: hypothetical protein DMF62_14055 [Acidobacteria bacterium]|nr:MAG: hypothetical protein DMF62_14055 [Acidobacteriota bacterium]